MQTRGGTSSATGGSPRTTWQRFSFEVRLIGFALAVGVMTFLIVKFDANIWRAQEHLQEGFAAIRAEKFYFGVNFRMSLRKLRDSLLDYQLTGNDTDLERYKADSDGLKQWLEAKSGNFVSLSEQAAFSRLESSYAAFLARMNELLRTNGLPSGPEGFAAAYWSIRQEAQRTLDAGDDVVQAEHREFDRFLVNSDQALTSLQHLFAMSLLLLITLAGAVAVLVYRGMIAPLRARLTESQHIIERQEKLAALGALGAGVAHEIRNPLTAIKFRLFSLKKSLPPEFAGNEDTRVISDEINRLDRIVKDFLQFARPSEPDLVRVPAERLLKGVQDLMKPELEPAGIELKLEVVQPAWIQADTSQLRQVLINLVQNSADSIERQGRVTLRLTHGRVAFRNGEQRAAILAVADTGKGIPAEVQKRLFDPFFTTKEGGTGLGLAIAARIVEKHGGVLRYQTGLNRGTIFEVVLPEIEEHAS